MGKCGSLQASKHERWCKSKVQVQEGRVGKRKDRRGGRGGVGWMEEDVRGVGKEKGKVLWTFEDAQEGIGDQEPVAEKQADGTVQKQLQLKGR